MSESVNRQLAVIFVFIGLQKHVQTGVKKHTFFKTAEWVEMNGTMVNITGCSRKKVIGTSKNLEVYIINV